VPFYQPHHHPLGKCWAIIILGSQTKPPCFDFSSSNFPLQALAGLVELLLPYFHLRKGWMTPYYACSYLISISEKD
jgi:hypothetical protein